MKCPEITGLTFSASGERAIQAIRDKQKLANVLAGMLAITPLFEIFGRKGGLHSPLPIVFRNIPADAKFVPGDVIMIDVSGGELGFRKSERKAALA